MNKVFTIIATVAVFFSVSTTAVFAWCAPGGFIGTTCGVATAGMTGTAKKQIKSITGTKAELMFQAKANQLERERQLLETEALRLKAETRRIKEAGLFAEELLRRDEMAVNMGNAASNYRETRRIIRARRRVFKQPGSHGRAYGVAYGRDVRRGGWVKPHSRRRTGRRGQAYCPDPSHPYLTDHGTCSNRPQGRRARHRSGFRKAGFRRSSGHCPDPSHPYLTDHGTCSNRPQ